MKRFSELSSKAKIIAIDNYLFNNLVITENDLTNLFTKSNDNNTYTLNKIDCNISQLADWFSSTEDEKTSLQIEMIIDANLNLPNFLKSINKSIIDIELLEKIKINKLDSFSFTLSPNCEVSDEEKKLIEDLSYDVYSCTLVQHAILEYKLLESILDNNKLNFNELTIKNDWWFNEKGGLIEN